MASTRVTSTPAGSTAGAQHTARRRQASGSVQAEAVAEAGRTRDEGGGVERQRGEEPGADTQHVCHEAGGGVAAIDRPPAPVLIQPGVVVCSGGGRGMAGRWEGLPVRREVGGQAARAPEAPGSRGQYRGLRTCVGVAEEESLRGWVASMAEAIHQEAATRDELVRGRRPFHGRWRRWRRRERSGQPRPKAKASRLCSPMLQPRGTTAGPPPRCCRSGARPDRRWWNRGRAGQWRWPNAATLSILSTDFIPAN